MLQSNCVMFGWNHPATGREAMASELFAHCVNWCEKQRSIGNIESFEPMFLQSHGGDLNGCFLIKGTHAQLDSLKSHDEWVDIVMRAGQCLTQVGVVDCYTGTTVQDMMSRWTRSIPPR
ncbi:MAG: hypothetical protein JWP01_3002 [Myxococcales bacterium]|nr:hypothetical protein [Myxococcales bacterium]